MTPPALFIVLWFVISFALSFTGILERLPAPALVVTGLLTPGFGFAALYRFSTSFRRFFRNRSLRVLTWGQIFRLYGILALFMTYNHVLPAIFAIPTAIIDILFALSSIVVSKNLISRHGYPRRGFVKWNVLGLAGLAISFTLAILTSSANFPLAHDGITTQAMRQYPISLVPIFIGPLVLSFHVFAIAAAKLMRGRRDERRFASVIPHHGFHDSQLPTTALRPAL